VIAAFVAPAAVAGEGEGPLMWLSWARVHPGGDDTWTDVMKQTYGVSFDKLLKSGEVIGWGLAAKANHGPGPSHVMWITVGDWEDMDTLFNAIDADFASRNPGDLERLFGAVNKATDPSVHFDSVVRHSVFNWEPGGDVAPKYIMTGNWTAKPGGDVNGLYNEYVVPINEDLMSKGVIHSFGMYEPVLHDGTGITHTGWTFVTDLGKMNAIEKAFDTLDADPAFGQKFAAAFDFATHRDYIWSVIHLGGMPAK
jgi:hypothetical protein